MAQLAPSNAPFNSRVAPRNGLPGERPEAPAAASSFAPAPPAPPVPAPPAPVVPTQRPDDSYALKVGDRVSFSIEEDRRAPAELVVLASGDVEVANVGRFQAAGKTCRTLAAQLKVELEKRYYKTATVTVGLNQLAVPAATGQASGAAVAGGIRVFFNGAVASTGMREFAPDARITVSRAILIGGGFKDFANQKKVQLIRRGASGKSRIVVVNVQDVLKGKSDIDPLVEADDLIFVPEKLFNF